MAAGKYRDRITIEQPSTDANASGELVKTWSTYVQRWANAEPDAATESSSTADRQTKAERKWTITLRADPQTKGITSRMRVVHAGRVLQIGGVRTPNRIGVMTLDCTERIDL